MGLERAGHNDPIRNNIDRTMTPRPGRRRRACSPPLQRKISHLGTTESKLSALIRQSCRAYWRVERCGAAWTRAGKQIVIGLKSGTANPVRDPAGTFTFSKDSIETRHVMLGIRTFVDPNDPADANKVHALQDAINVEQRNAGSWVVPAWDPVSQKKVRDELLKRAANIPDTKGMFGARGKVDPERRLIGTATGWGGNSEENATYLTVVPPKNDGKIVHKMTVKNEVPVDGFWSISVYGADGYFHKSEQNSYSINNVTARKDADGSVSIQFGGCDGSTPNCIPITKGWNYWVRLYRPRKEILDGTFKFPEAQPVG